MTDVRLIGVDWATRESHRGIAVVDYSDESTALIELSPCKAPRTALRIVADAMSSAALPCLIAIDAPLGWPIGLSMGLAQHVAGQGLDITADAMFSRDTDRFVRSTLKKRPLEVGANLIARTAHSADQFLRDLRHELRCAIPLLWAPEELRDSGVIEVYPAATKIAAGLQTTAATLGIGDGKCATKHVEDALWCAAAALHFVRTECYPPLDVDKSRREGWIWFRRVGV
jgi:predicted nuclease with RNAse H fold